VSRVFDERPTKRVALDSAPGSEGNGVLKIPLTMPTTLYTASRKSGTMFQRS
jgi:hypothetical protein